MEIYCCKCKKVRKCILVTGKEIYPARPELHSLYFWKCQECGQYVGCHKNTQEPLGVIPTQEMKKARQIIHSFMDSMWKTGKIFRKKSIKCSIFTKHSFKQCRYFLHFYYPYKVFQSFASFSESVISLGCGSSSK